MRKETDLSLTIITSIKIVYVQVWTGIKAFIYTPIIWFIERFIFSDWDFGISLLIALLFDGFISIMVSLFRKDISVLKMLTEWSLRSMVLALGVIAVSIVDKALIEGNKNELIDWVHSGFLVIFLVAILAGILNNLYMIYPAEWIKEALKKIGFKKNENEQKGNQDPA
jgi:hypothetical protein